MSESFKAQVGLDWRTAEIEHYREVRDLLGGDGTGNELTANTGNITGYQVKTGGLYNINDQVAIFGNAGYVSKVPIFDGVIDDVGGNINDDPHNEAFLSMEAGAGYRSRDRRLSVKLNIYNTEWRDRTVTRSIILADGSDGLINLIGLDALHQGIEAEVTYQPFDLLRFNGAAAIANWKYTDDVTGTFRPDDRSSEVEQFDYYLKGLKVGDAPQTQFSYAVSIFPAEGVYLQVVGKTFSNHYSNFDPRGRTDPTDRTQSWKAPGYTVIDLHAGYDLPLSSLPVKIQIFTNVFNLFDTVYIQDALDNSRFNGFDGDHDADDAEVFFGLLRTFTLGFSVTY